MEDWELTRAECYLTHHYYETDSNQKILIKTQKTALGRAEGQEESPHRRMQKNSTKKAARRAEADMRWYMRGKKKRNRGQRKRAKKTGAVFFPPDKRETHYETQLNYAELTLNTFWHTIFKIWHFFLLWSLSDKWKWLKGSWKLCKREFLKFV